MPRPLVAWGEIFTWREVCPNHSASRMYFIASLRASRSSRSRNKMPSRWSVSCWIARESISVPSTVTGSPYMSKPRATTDSARLHSMRSSGSDRQPSGPSWISSDKVSSGFTRWPSSPSTCQVKTRSPTPSWGAASPAPGASIIVSVRSATSVRSSLSKSTTGAAGVRSTGSPNNLIGLMDTRAPPGWVGGQSRSDGPRSHVRSRSAELGGVDLYPHVGQLARRALGLERAERGGQRSAGVSRHAYDVAHRRLVEGVPGAVVDRHGTQHLGAPRQLEGRARLLEVAGGTTHRGHAGGRGQVRRLPLLDLAAGQPARVPPKEGLQPGVAGVTDRQHLSAVRGRPDQSSGVGPATQGLLRRAQVRAGEQQPGVHQQHRRVAAGRHRL